MTNDLKQFLKENSHILNERDFPTLFQKCSSKILKKELLSTLKSNPEIEAYLSQIGTQDLYYFVSKDTKYFLGIYAYDKRDKKYLIGSERNNPSNHYKIIVMHGFEKSLAYALDNISGDYNPQLLPVDIEENWDWVPVKTYVGNDIFTTQELVDSFNPAKIKDNRILAAAKEEYNNEVNYYLNRLFGSSKGKKDEFRSELYSLLNRSVYIYNDTTFGCLEISCFNENDKIREHEDEVLSLIKEYIPRKDVKIIKYHKGFKVYLNRDLINKIKSEISDTFEIKL